MRTSNIAALALPLLALASLLNPTTTSAVPRLTAGVVRGFPGRTVEVPITLRYRTNDVRDVVALQADLIYETADLTEGTLASGPITANHIVDSSHPSAGTRRLLVYSPANSVLTNGEIARIPFTVAPNAFRNFTLHLENVIMVRADASQVFGTAGNGAIAVNAVYLGENGTADGFINVSTNESDQCFVIQATTNFRTWINVQTNSTESALLQFVDPQAGSYPSRFYRAILCDRLAGLQLGTIAQLAGNLTQLAGNRVRFDFTGAAGRSYVIQASTNLSDWLNLRTNVGAGEAITFIDSFTNHARRFYRVRAAE